MFRVFSVFKLVQRGIMEDTVHLFVHIIVRHVDVQTECVHVKQSGWDGIAKKNVYLFNDYSLCKLTYI